MFNYQGYCPYMFVPYRCAYPMTQMPNEQVDTEGNKSYRQFDENINELEGLNFEIDELRDNEDLDYLIEVEKRSAVDVDRVMLLIEPRHKSLFDQLERAGVKRVFTRYMLRNIVMFVDTNYDKYPGTIQQKVTAALNNLRRQYPWIFFVMRAYGVPIATVNQVVRGILVYSFQNLRRP